MYFLFSGLELRKWAQDSSEKTVKIWIVSLASFPWASSIFARECSTEICLEFLRVRAKSTDGGKFTRNVFMWRARSRVFAQVNLSCPCHARRWPVSRWRISAAAVVNHAPLISSRPRKWDLRHERVAECTAKARLLLIRKLRKFGDSICSAQPSRCHHNRWLRRAFASSREWHRNLVLRGQISGDEILTRHFPPVRDHSPLFPCQGAIARPDVSNAFTWYFSHHLLQETHPDSEKIVNKGLWMHGAEQKHFRPVPIWQSASWSPASGHFRS